MTRPPSAHMTTPETAESSANTKISLRQPSEILKENWDFNTYFQGRPENGNLPLTTDGRLTVNAYGSQAYRAISRGDTDFWCYRFGPACKNHLLQGIDGDTLSGNLLANATMFLWSLGLSAIQGKRVYPGSEDELNMRNDELLSIFDRCVSAAREMKEDSTACHAKTSEITSALQELGRVSVGYHYYPVNDPFQPTIRQVWAPGCSDNNA